MAAQTYYGSSVANGTLPNACTMSSTTGGVETSKTTTTSGAGNNAEVLSQGGTSTAVGSIPATPTGHGWVTPAPGAGTYATGNWSATVTLSSAFQPITYTIRFFRYSSGTYTSIGTIATTANNTAKTAWSFAATSMGTITFGVADLLYVDLWGTDSGGIATDNPVVYESTSSSAGVANDVQITTSNFTASGGGGTHLRIMDGFGGVFS